MPQRIGIVILLILATNALSAQENLNYPKVDSVTYALFQQQEWGQLINYAELARKQGIDFFYLKARTGIAWYNLGKYRKAAEWFLKASENDPSPDWLQEYLYYSLAFSARKTEAQKYAAGFYPAVRKKIGLISKGVTRAGIEAGYSYNPSFENLKSRDFAGEVSLGTDYGEGYFLKDYRFQSFDLSHRAGSNLSINHNFTHLGVNRETVVNWVEQTSSPVRLDQYQYYINPVWVAGKKWNISPSLNFIFGKGDLYAGWLNSNSERNYSTTKVNYTDVVFSTSVWSDFGNFSPGAEYNTGKLNDIGFTQISAWTIWYPFSNANLYLIPKAYFQSKSTGGGLKYIATGISGGFVSGPIHLNCQYLVGDMQNFVEGAGYLIYNFPGKSTRKMAANLFSRWVKKSGLWSGISGRISPKPTRFIPQVIKAIRLNTIILNILSQQEYHGIFENTPCCGAPFPLRNGCLFAGYPGRTGGCFLKKLYRGKKRKF